MSILRADGLHLEVVYPFCRSKLHASKWSIESVQQSLESTKSTQFCDIHTNVLYSHVRVLMTEPHQYELYEILIKTDRNTSS